MDELNEYAIQCAVTLYVTHAFRLKSHGHGIGSRFQPNHLIGQAIQFNLNTPNEWCSDRCLSAPKRNLEAKCFIDKVRRNTNLQNTEPVVISSTINPSSDLWQQLHDKNQKNCFVKE